MGKFKSGNFVVSFTTVTYGLNCSPYLVLKTLLQLVEDEGHRFSLAVPSLIQGRYVDDIFGGADSIEETKLIMNQLTQLCNAGGFPLQKWHSNSPELLFCPAKNNLQTTSAVEFEASQVKVLGMSWEATKDVFKFITFPKFSEKITKRSIFSEISQLFDPLGLVSPILTRAKILIQELWLSKVAWDEPLPSEFDIRWRTFRNQLVELSSINMLRWLYVSATSRTVEIHGFSDASNLSMAAVVYLRIIEHTGEIKVSLVCSKTRVAPIKRMTIPRLELNAACLLTRLVSHIQRIVSLKNPKIYLWTDSSVTLTWITAHPSRWKDYVRNRVTIIQELEPDAVWGFVPGKQNPADCASRGLLVTQLLHHSLWWSGPLWLSQASENWPSRHFERATKANREERSRQILVSTKNLTGSQVWNLIHRYSSLTRLLRITAICFKVASRFRKQKSQVIFPITPNELQSSRDFWIKTIQHAYFLKEIEAVKTGQTLSKSNPLVRLTPFLDKDGILRVGGRLQNSYLTYEKKHPIIFPKSSRFTDLQIKKAHLLTLHGGTQVTLAYIRQDFWILGGRTPVRSHILRCVRCTRFRGQRAQQLMGQLPLPRVTPSRPFMNTGVDYAGPIYLKTWSGRSAKVYKGYIAIFVCMSTSAVHIEIVTDYTTEAFIAAFKRFTGRRGICATLFSDCGTNFVGADKALRQRFDNASKELKELADLLANDSTGWRFNPPSAPHFGGKWEAAVKSTKYHLLRTIGESILTFEKLTTLMTQIEAILNSRPLTPLSDDSDDLAVLTPGHFLIGQPLSIIPEPNLIEKPMNRLTQWQ